MTSASPSLSVLLASEHAEEIKLISTSLRGFFPDCRIEAVYTSDEAVQWSTRNDWHLIVIDENLGPRNGVDLIPELKRNCPHAAIILQTDRRDSATALRALQQGADFLLFKDSPGFATELIFYAQDATEKRELEIKLEHTFQRHLRLIESLSDVVYELDPDGRFVYLSPNITSLLGYAPEELAGRHFSLLLPIAQHRTASYRFNERRAGTRSIHHLELSILGKKSAGTGEGIVLVDLTAKGLYGEHGQYLGTVGILRNRSDYRQQTEKVRELEVRLREADRQLVAARNAALASRQLQQPLYTLLQDSHQLLATMQNIRIDQHLTQLAQYATQATKLAHDVWKSIHFRGHAGGTVSLNSELEQLLADLSRDQSLHPNMVEAHMSHALPHIAGNKHELKELFRILIAYALQALTETPDGGRLLVETYAEQPAGTAAAPPLSFPPPLLFSPYVVVVIRHQTAMAPPKVRPVAMHVTASEFLRAHDIVRQHSGSVEFGSALDPPFRITVRFPGIPLQDSQLKPGEFRSRETHPVTFSQAPTSSSTHSAPSSPDRRRFNRTILSLSVELTVGEMVWRGTTVNIGTGGMLLISPQPVPPIENQPVYLVLRTSVGFLEIQGTVRYRPELFTPEMDSTGFVIEFAPLLTEEEAVLNSFVESFPECLIPIKIEGLIPETTQNRHGLRAGPSLQKEQRWHVRIRLMMPIRITFPSQNRYEPLFGYLTDAGKGGVCVRVIGSYGEVGDVLFVQRTPTPQSGRILSGESAFHNVSGRIAWIVQNDAEGSRCIGVRFDRLSLESEQSLDYFLHNELINGSLAETSFGQNTLDTSLRFLRNQHGKALALSHDRLTDRVMNDSPILIISPGYGQGRVDYIGIGRHLGTHGFRILRYDPTHALGLSDGEPHNLTIGTMKDDLETVITFARAKWPQASIAVLASDLAARAALKLFGQVQIPDMLLLVNPIVDLSDTLRDMHHRNLFEEHQTGARFGLMNLMGLQIDADRFLHDAMVNGFMDLASAMHDIGRLQCHVCLFETPSPGRTLKHSSSKEAELTKQAIGLLGARGTAVTLSTAVIDDGPTISETRRQSFHDIHERCKRLALDIHPVEVNGEAEAAELAGQYRREVEQLRTKPTHSYLQLSALWFRHAEHSRQFSDIAVSLQHSSRLYHLLRLSRNQYDILDVGCGQYGFARLWMLNEFYRSWSVPVPDDHKRHYTGIDILQRTIKSSREAFTEIQRRIGIVFPGMPGERPHIIPRWIAGDTAAFPFPDERFHYIVCHFALNFSDNPVITLRELYRLLRPAGILVVSSYTPIADPAEHYRAHLSATQQHDPSNRGILLELAQLREAIRCRRVHSFTTESLTALFRQITTQPVLPVPSFENHVLIATVQKPDSIRHI
ncbi:PilZ domain-containing protein [Nitrospira sp. Nam80]